MLWFKKKDQLREIERLEKRLEREIPEHKRQESRVVDRANKVGEDVKRQVEDNHFTIKIFLAAGGGK